MKTPEVYTLSEMHGKDGVVRRLHNGLWITGKPMRGQPVGDFIDRLVTTWCVFTGRYDALDLRK